MTLNVVSFTTAFGALVLALTGIKILLIPAYHSTDFEVHRNWLAITYSLPLERWYYENTSQWTLDYPPAFAWFEASLSQVGAIVDPEMVKIDRLNYASEATVNFQRLSVIASELVLVAAVYWLAKEQSDCQPISVAFLILASPGLLIVDHIHFQYNGFLFGVLFWFIWSFGRGRYFLAAALFALLLNLKHIFLYMAPAVTLALFKFACFPRPRMTANGAVSLSSLSPLPLMGLGAIVVTVFAIFFGPFVYLGQLGQVLSRLFPFHRGLCHAYWAPNAWALYAGLDKALSILLKPSSVRTGSFTGGLVGDQEFSVLPDVRPIVTLVATIVFMAPALWRFWCRSNPRRADDSFVGLLTWSAIVSFYFGWHVHEKAICMALLPFALICRRQLAYYRQFATLSFAGYYSLFPLLFTRTEYPIKIGFLCLYSIALLLIDEYEAEKSNLKRSAIFWLAVATAVSLETIWNLVVPLVAPGLLEKLPFLPLMATSLTCSAFIGLASIQFAFNFWNMPDFSPVAGPRDHETQKRK